jgi:hypothetical protein
LSQLTLSEVLLIDDRPETLGDLVAELDVHGLSAVLIPDYDAATEYIGALDGWAGFGLIDVHLPSASADQETLLGLALGRQIRGRFGDSALFAYVTVLSRRVPPEDYLYGEPTSELGVIDKYELIPQEVARSIAQELAP